MEKFTSRRATSSCRSSQFYGCAVRGHRRRSRSPRTSRTGSTSTSSRRTTGRPLERKAARVFVAVDDPHDLTRVDAIKATNLAPRIEIQVALREDIQKLRREDLRRGEGRGRRGARRDRHPDGPGGEVETERGGRRGRGRRAGQRRSSSSPTRSSSTPTARAPPTSTSSPTARSANTMVRFRIDGDCQIVPGDPAAVPQRAGVALQDHGAARHRRAAQAPGRQDPLQAARRARSSCASPPSRPSAATRTW